VEVLMKAVICVGLLVVAFVFGVRSEPAIKQGVDVAGRKLDLVLTVEDQIRAAKVEVRRLELAMQEREKAIASLEPELAQLKAQAEALRAEKADAVADADAARFAVSCVEEQKAELAGRLEARDAELRDLKEVMRKASNELTCAPETPVSVLAVE
jgi:hypothetical protein